LHDAAEDHLDAGVIENTDDFFSDDKTKQINSELLSIVKDTYESNYEEMKDMSNSEKSEFLRSQLVRNPSYRSVAQQWKSQIR